jgi:GAF domain-containing protein
MNDHADHAAGGPRTGSRDSALAEAFVTLADTLVEDFDVVELLHRLVQACVDLLDATAAGLLLLDPRAQLRVVASSGEQAHLLEMFQLYSDEGPCLDCVRTGAPVSVDDLEAAEPRWPRFAPAARQAGFRSVRAVPLRLRSEVIGGLNLFHAGTVSLPPADLRIAQALADVATIGILQQRAIHRSSVLAEQLQTALNSRIVLEQAKGMLAEHGQVSMEVAFGCLRGFARDHNRKLGDVALALTEGRLELDGVLTARRPR